MSTAFCPGRVELAGNHTDHQKGRVIAAAIEKGITASAEPNGENVIRIFSEGFEPVQITLDHLWPEESEAGTATALVRGMAAVLSAQLDALTGFDAYYTSDLPAGAGLASSAAFSVLTGHLIASFAASEPIPPEELAKAAQKAENRWFGKPCGLMDQMACAIGGCIYMDLLENKTIRLECDLDELGLALCLTETGSSHLQGTDAYTSIIADMTEIAHLFHENFLAQVRQSDFDEVWPEHRQERQWMRARHFFDETMRVTGMADALGLRDGMRYLELMNESGRSSEQLLQNITYATAGQELAECLEASSRLLQGKGAWRVHGGGFGGCVQALMPIDVFPAYCAAMDALFGKGACHRVHICPQGVHTIDEVLLHGA